MLTYTAVCFRVDRHVDVRIGPIEPGDRSRKGGGFGYVVLGGRSVMDPAEQAELQRSNDEGKGNVSQSQVHLFHDFKGQAGLLPRVSAR